MDILAVFASALAHLTALLIFFILTGLADGSLRFDLSVWIKALKALSRRREVRVVYVYERKRQ